VKTLVASLHHFYNSEGPLPPAYTIFTTVKDSENPSCQPTPFSQQWRTVKTLVASLHHFYNSEGPLPPAYTIFTTVKDSENPSCQHTPFLQQWRTVKTLVVSLHHFTRFIAPFHSLAASLHHFTTVKDIENPSCQTTPFYTVYCPIIYFDLCVRLKKVHGFLSFSHWKLWVFLRFSHGFFPTASRTYADNVRPSLPESAHKRCFVTVKSVFINRYTASLYRHYTGN
jgi:hypothetical protein